MKRFWTEVTVEDAGAGFGIRLDGRAVRTPARAELLLPTPQLAEAVADEWRSVGETIDPRAMPFTGFANAAIDRVAAAPDSFAANLAKFGETDLLCYRAEGPTTLVERQAEAWDALLGWARRRYDVDFACATGIMHVGQPAETIAKLEQAVRALDAFQLAGLSPLVTIGGSLVAALAVLEEAMPPEAAWEAVSLDDRWQVEQWGADEEAVARLDARRGEFLAAARFLALLA